MLNLTVVFSFYHFRKLHMEYRATAGAYFQRSHKLPYVTQSVAIQNNPGRRSVLLWHSEHAKRLAASHETQIGSVKFTNLRP